MQFSSVESLMSFAMGDFCAAWLKKTDFEDMRVPLAIVASDLTAGVPVVFRDRGDVLMPIHASCAYPGCFRRSVIWNIALVDGMVAMDVPRRPLRRMGATHVVSVMLPSPPETIDPRNMQSVVRPQFPDHDGAQRIALAPFVGIVIAPEVMDSSDAQHMIRAGSARRRRRCPRFLKWLPCPWLLPEAVFSV